MEALRNRLAQVAMFVTAKKIPFLMLLGAVVALSILHESPITGARGEKPASSAMDGEAKKVPDSGPSSQPDPGVFTLADLREQVPQDADGNFLLDVPSLFASTADPQVTHVLSGQPVVVEGRVIPEKVDNPNGTRLRLLVIQVTCCAVDARPYAILLEFAEKPPGLKDMTWVKARGVVGYRTQGDKLEPFITANRIEEMASPEGGGGGRWRAFNQSNPY
jgi:hypothetical protein